MQGEPVTGLLQQPHSSAHGLWGPTPGHPTEGLLPNGDKLVSRGSHNLIARDQVLNVSLDLVWGDGACPLKHQLPSHECRDLVKPQLVNPVDQVLLQLGKAVLNHLVQIWAVGWV